MSDGASLLDTLLQSELFPKPASSVEECVVGPSSDERMVGNPRWGSRGSQSSKRRRRVDECGVGGATKEKSNYATSSSDSSSLSQAMKTFLSSGCCIIPDVLPNDFVQKSKSKVTSDLEFLSTELQNRRMEAIESNQEHLIARVARGDFRELIDRDGGRRDVRFQLDRYPFTSPGLIYNPIVYSLVRELLGGGDVNLLYAGVMWALPQLKPKKVPIESVSQKWHADGGHLFDHHHLPPHCINVFYPLIDLTSEHGPTETMPGTHRLGKLNDVHASKFGLCCDAGSATLFDYRLNHRGGANFSSEARPVMYLCYAKPFFRDAGNTRSGHSIVKSSSVASPQWVARILTGDPVAMGEGFEYEEVEVGDEISDAQVEPSAETPINNAPVGSGERWILFKMNVELPDREDPAILTVHHGDVPREVSSQFCREHKLGNEFIPVLAESINSQIQASLQSKS